MVHKTRKALALLTLLGGFATATAQEPLPMPVAPASSVGPVGGMPSPGGALYNYYQGGAVPPGAVPPGAEMPPGGLPPGSVVPPGKLGPDPFGPQRMQMPTGVLNHEFAGGTPYNGSTRPDDASLGIRLDTSYKFLRQAEVGTYLSEHQSVGAAAVTVLPFQAPCWLVGLRAGAAYNGNNDMAPDILGATTDLFWATRYKAAYIKLGYFGDWTNKHRKHGFSHGILFPIPEVGNLCFEGAYGFGDGKDQELDPRDPNTLQLRRVEIAKSDVQIRLSTFMSAYLQVGAVGKFANYREAKDEYNAGLFANWFIGGTTVSAEFTGGNGGAQGYVNLGFNWGGGANIDKHPIDTRYVNPIDTVSWVTKAVQRDITMKLRETEHGSPPPQVVPVILQ